MFTHNMHIGIIERSPSTIKHPPDEQIKAFGDLLKLRGTPDEFV